MHKNTPNREPWRITDLVSHLPEETILPVEPQGDSTVSVSPERIKQLAMQKRKDYLKGNEEKPMKKITVRIVLIAAIICLLSITAVAAFGGMDYIRGIFGDSADEIENAVVTPQVAASANGRDLALEALVTDGFVTNMVVSLTGEQPANDKLFTVSTDASLRSNGWYVLDEFTTEEKTYYVVGLISKQRFDSANVTLTLNKDVAPIDLVIPVQNTLGNAVVSFPENAASGGTKLKELQVSPMGFLLIGHEDDAKGGLPPTSITLLLADGSSNQLDVEFEPSDEKVIGGGGAVISPGPGAPLVTSFHGTRNPDGELVIDGQFSRIINPDEIISVKIDGAVYPIDKTGASGG